MQKRKDLKSLKFVTSSTIKHTALLRFGNSPAVTISYDKSLLVTALIAPLPKAVVYFVRRKK